MFTLRSTVLKYLPLLTGAALFILSASRPVLWAEPIQFSNEQKPVDSEKKAPVVQEKVTTSKFFKPYRPADTVSGSIESPFAAPLFQAPPSSAPPPRTSRHTEEMLDRRRNWIFAQPGDNEKKGTAEEALGIDDFMTGGKRSQTLIGRFLENKKPDDSGVNKLDSNRRQPWEMKELGFRSNLGYDDQSGQNEEIKETKPGAANPAAQRRPDLSGFSAEQTRLAEIWMEQHGPDAKKNREQKEMRMSEFESLFAPLKQSAPGASTLGQANLGTQLTSPLTPGLGLGSLQAPSQIADQSRNTRTLSASGGPTLPDANARLFGPASVATPAQPAPRVDSQPAILPFPKRRF